jgi:hypothetical protein
MLRQAADIETYAAMEMEKSATYKNVRSHSPDDPITLKLNG